MTTAELKDLCLVKLDTYRSKLDAAFAGTGSHILPQDLAAIRAELTFWEGVTVNINHGDLTPEQEARIAAEQLKAQ